MSLAAEIVLPHPVKDLGLGQHPARVAQKVAQQFELGSGELYSLATSKDLMSFLIQRQVGHRQIRRSGFAGGTRATEQAS
jgi:hypothetical protein